MSAQKRALRMAGLKKPFGDLLGRRGKKSSGVNDAPCLRVRRPTRRTSTPRRRRDVVGGSSERRGLIQAIEAFLDTE